MCAERCRWLLSACEAARELGLPRAALESEASETLAALEAGDDTAIESRVAVDLVALGVSGEWFERRVAARDMEEGRKMLEAKARFYDRRPKDVGTAETSELFRRECSRLTLRAVDLWEATGTTEWPPCMRTLTREEQKRNNSRCGAIARRGKATTVEENRESIRIVLNVEEAFVSDVMVGRNVFEATRAFSRIATTQFGMPEREEFQAGRNAWAAFALQLLFAPDGRAECTSGVAGYSLMYPLSDNYLDDAKVPIEDKLAFQARFGDWLSGGACARHDKRDEQVLQCVKLVEESHSRHSSKAFVWQSVLAIHAAQTESLQQHAALDERRVIEISVHKGGTSVLADMFVVDANPTQRAVMFSFFFGVALQLVDDLQDIKEDAADGQHTIFTLAQRNGTLRDGGLVRRLCSFLALLVGEETVVERGILAMSMQMALKAAARIADSLSRDFVDEAEYYCPLPMSAMKKLAGLKTLLGMIKQNRV